MYAIDKDKWEHDIVEHENVQHDIQCLLSAIIKLSVICVVYYCLPLCNVMCCLFLGYVIVDWLNLEKLEFLR